MPAGANPAELASSESGDDSSRQTTTEPSFSDLMMEVWCKTPLKSAEPKPQTSVENNFETNFAPPTEKPHILPAVPGNPTKPAGADAKPAAADVKPPGADSKPPVAAREKNSADDSVLHIPALPDRVLPKEPPQSEAAKPKREELLPVPPVDAENVGRPKITRHDQREINKDQAEKRELREGDGALETASSPVAEARKALESELQRHGHLNDKTRAILNDLEGNTKAFRAIVERMGKYPEAKTLQERLDLKHYDPDAVPSDEKIAATYRIAAETLRSHGVGPFNTDKAVAKIVIEGLRNVSDITGIDQGSYTTCGPASGEKYIAARSPDRYMDAIKQLVQTGVYRTPNGNAFNYNSNSWNDKEDGQRILRPNLQPGGEESNWNYKNEGSPNKVANLVRVQEGTRNWASQAIQNLFLENAKVSYSTRQISDGVTAQLAGKTVPATTFRHIEDFTARVTGTPMTTINQNAAIPSAANIGRPIDDNLANQLQYSGRYPVLDWIGPHWFTTNAAVKMEDGTARVLQDNQWGRVYDGGWTTVQQRTQKAAASLRAQGYNVQ
jgi:hypothetical protein